VTSKVVYLDPIQYEEYKDMHVKEISEMVKRKIADAIEKYSE
jgi:L-rhamnose mutarotase